MRIFERMRIIALGLALCAASMAAMGTLQSEKAGPAVLGLQNDALQSESDQSGSPDSMVRRFSDESAATAGEIDWSQMIVRMRGEDAAASTAMPSAPPLAVPAAVQTTAANAVPVPVPVPAPGSVANTAVSGPTATVAPVLSRHAQRGEAALGQIGFDLASIGYTISFHPHTGSHRGLTFTRRQHIEVYVRPSMSDGELAYVIAHEMGHALDHMRNTHDFRARWQASRGIAANTPWWPVGVGSDFATPAGDFAECFASWAVGSPSHSVWGGCGQSVGLVQELVYQ